MVFKTLNPQIQGLIKKREWSSPTLPQEKTIPKILSGENVLVMAPTGIGKTESAMLPIFSKWVEQKPAPISILYITPLRALNRDMLQRMLWWAKHLEIDVAVRHGDTTDYERRKQVEFPPDLLITTPETLQAILPGSKLKQHLSNVKYVIVDETHELVENKRGVQLTIGLERLRELCGDFQIIGLSATIGSPEKASSFLGGDKPVKIVEAMTTKELDIIVDSPRSTKLDKEIAEKIYVGEDTAARLKVIQNLIENHRSALVFTNTRESAEVLSSRLRNFEKKFEHDIHHSSLSKEVRIQAEDQFKKEEIKALICTSSLELGIDIGSIDLIIQYMSPRQVTKLVQRVGRSGHRVGEKSKGVIIAAGPDDILESAVIARKAMAGELEEMHFHNLAWDVLANQTIGLALDEYDTDWKKIYNIVKRAFPYKDLEKRKLSDLLNFLQNMRMIYLNATVRRKRKAWRYYYENLSTIPDVYQYKVVDTIENREVGVLDEEFVAEHGEVGTTFVVKGRSWRVLSLDKGIVFVEPVEEIESAIPAWEGELIPVPEEVAKEVELLRKRIADLIKKKKDYKEIIKDIRQDYPLTANACAKIIKYIKEQAKDKRNLSEPNKLVIEEGEEFVVIHSCYGSLINEALSRFLGAMLTGEFGTSIAIKSDPYRIMIQGADKDAVIKVLKENDSEDLEIVLENSVERSSMFKWRFLHVAKRFGALTKRAKWDKINISKFIDTYRDTLIFEEAKKEVFLEKMDVKGAKKFLDIFHSGKLKIVEEKGLSPIGRKGLEFQFRELIGPEKPEKEIFTAFKDRLLATSLRLICMRCGEFRVTKTVANIKEDPVCPVCKSRLITAIKPYQKELEEIIKKDKQGKELTEQEKKKLKKLEDIADLVLTFGKGFIIALAGRGVGPDAAIRILAKQREDPEKFYEDVLDAEREYTRTKRYWRT
jgi:ATP-dependent Lhr-like helicase